MVFYFFISDKPLTVAPSVIVSQELTMSKRARVGQSFTFDVVRYDGGVLGVTCQKELEEMGLNPKKLLQARRFEVELDGYYGDKRFAIQNVVPPRPPFIGDLKLYQRVLALYRLEYPQKSETFTENWYFNCLKLTIEENNRRGRGFMNVDINYRNSLTEEKQSLFDSIIESQRTNVDLTLDQVRERHMFD